MKVTRRQIGPYTASVGGDGQIQELESLQPSDSTELSPGQVIAIGEHHVDDEGSFRFQLARFVSFSDGDPEWLDVTYMGTVKSEAPYKFQDV